MAIKKNKKNKNVPPAPEVNHPEAPPPKETEAEKKERHKSVVKFLEKTTIRDIEVQVPVYVATFAKTGESKTFADSKTAHAWIKELRDANHVQKYIKLARAYAKRLGDMDVTDVPAEHREQLAIALKALNEIAS